MLYSLHRRRFRTSFTGKPDGHHTLLVGSGIFSYWKLKYKHYRCNRFFLRKKISSNFETGISLRIVRKFSCYHPYQFIWESPGGAIVATNDSTVYRVVYRIEGTHCEGNIESSEDRIDLVINGEYDERLMLPILGEFASRRMDGRDGDTA